MEKINERCIRYIYQEYDKKYFEILIEQKLTTLYGQRIRAMCLEIFKTINGLNAGYMNDLFADRPSKYPSRNTNKYPKKPIKYRMAIDLIEFKVQKFGTPCQ